MRVIVEELKKNWFTLEEENRIQNEVKREAKSKERAKRLGGAMFDLKIPCANCPFRKGMGSKFRLRRLGEIRRASSFTCHKTVDYSGFDEGRDGVTTAKSQHCAGLAAVLMREDAPNQMLRIAGRTGVDLDSFDPRGEAYASWAQVLRAHVNGEEPAPC